MVTACFPFKKMCGEERASAIRLFLRPYWYAIPAHKPILEGAEGTFGHCRKDLQAQFGCGCVLYVFADAPTGTLKQYSAKHSKEKNS
jgi:hypothetical protein